MPSLPLDSSESLVSPPARARYLRSLRQLPQLSAGEQRELERVTREYAFRVSDYYLDLIDWSDPNDPIRRLIIPQLGELNEWGQLDASNEKAITVAKGVQHKYPHTVLLLCNEVCGGYCRYCFRKRLFMNDADETTRDVSEGIRYIAANPNVTNVLLTGGDPLMMSSRHLADIIGRLRAIPHVRIIRIGSKMPAFDPHRLLEDELLHTCLRKYSTARKRIYLMAHFDHPRELTDAAIDCIDAFIRDGVICVNQCPLLRGINDDPVVLSDLFRELSFIGCPPYYLFQGRPTAGNEPFRVPIVRAWFIFRDALRIGSGLARRARFVMSHATGKIELVGVDSRYIYARYHRAHDPALRGQFLRYERNDEAYWLDELTPAGDPAPAADEFPDTGAADGPE
ncbi:MAG TPA: 4Fe-4S cluster-binding domain-containing protein [Phycisphaerae bacterium]|nr:4Fe-4S cluster-binding domain-containing protein [Phycisphaerae bacterium]HOJ72601.1 4Fe-4S cluster-binding domain-containing protein [Phycisphaerae bacterium]HOM49738.1 4Fe-4S cluster-binding domain-containing protein [Phycisphaerae bacterium]HON64970.1 4Fe-4S cluster-binding domain-containing protein [Phycisphaerae bacterium]HOQ84817.1 4Fe-4S cluster-binding domain-containing protein [Phycisphaerae bacterium]